jgi:uncharacterized protein
LGALSELPSAPCLSSRVETGIRIEAPTLAMVHAAETLVIDRLAPRTVRCRVRADGVVIELDEMSLAALRAGRDDGLRDELDALTSSAGFAGSVAFAAYRTGSAFLRRPS